MATVVGWRLQIVLLTLRIEHPQVTFPALQLRIPQITVIVFIDVLCFGELLVYFF